MNTRPDEHFDDSRRRAGVRRTAIILFGIVIVLFALAIFSNF